MSVFKKTMPEMKALLARASSDNPAVAQLAGAELAVALRGPLRQALFAGDIITNIFQPMDFTDGTSPEFDLDPIAPGMQKDFVAYTIPNQGRIPERHIEGDYVQVPAYDVGNSIDWLLKYTQNGRTDRVQRAMKVLRAGFTKKLNDDGWHTILAAGYDRGVVAFDGDAGSGQFTKRLISLMSTLMNRGSGGNSATPGRGRLTDIYLSPEAMEDMRNWGVDIIDEVTRNKIFNAGDDVLTRIFGVNLNRLDELGEGQEYQQFYLNALGGSIQSSDLELVVGLDLTDRGDTFVMPVVKEPEIFADPTLHRQRRQGFYGWMTQGFAILDNRKVILGSL